MPLLPGSIDAGRLPENSYREVGRYFQDSVAVTLSSFVTVA
jgi:hypothetical protein